MALGYQTPSNAFLDDHRPYYTVNYWDTVYTTESAGIEFSLFTLDDGPVFEDDSTGVGKTPKAVTRASMEGFLDDQALMTSVMGYTAGNYDSGVTPNVYHYWGSGALPGVKKGKRTLLKFRGDIKVGDNIGYATLVFGGQGRIQVYNQGVQILASEVFEPIPSPDFEYRTGGGSATARQTEFENQCGYAMVAFQPDVADDLEIYYWHHGENWGGVFCKVITGDVTGVNFNEDTIRESIRNAPVLGTSFMGIEAAGADLASSLIPYIDEISLDYNRDSVSTAVITVPLTTSDQPNGFSWNESTKTLLDNDTALTIKQDRRIEIVAGYAKPSDLKNASGVIAAAETYTRFTGHISSIQLTADFKSAEITCEDFSGKLLQTFDENYPDYLSYHANAYVYREGGHEPMFGIPAFDHWPLEIAIAEYCIRAGIDTKYLGRSPVDDDVNFAKRDAYTATGQVQRYLRTLFSARHLGDSTKPIRMERNSAYGNAGVLKKDFLPDDSPYLYTPEITRRLYDQVTQFADQYGYNFVFDPLGRAYLRAGNNPDELWTVAQIDDDSAEASPQLISGAGTGTPTGTWGSALVDVEAVNTSYMLQATDTGAWSISLEGYFSRLDLYAGIGLNATSLENGGVVDVSYEVWNGATYDAPTSPVQFSTYYDGPEAFFHQGPLRADGTNACLFEIFNQPFDRYRVTIENSATNGGVDTDDTGPAEYRLNAIGITYQSPTKNMFPVQFATDTNLLKLNAQSTHADLRNHVIVVGSRKAAITDSAKIAQVETNPANPNFEFNIHVASDPNSIYNPNAVNFVGNKRPAIIYDDKVSDSDFARWLALSTLFKFRDPQYKVPITTLAIPQLELGDALEIYEAAHDTVNQTVWVQSFNEKWAGGEATVDIVTSSYPDIPSYQPKLTPDVDALFGGEPAIDINIDYTNLLGIEVDRSDVDNPGMILGTDRSETMTADINERMVLTNTCMPETMWLYGPSVGDPITTNNRALVNHPYRKFWHILSWNGSNIPTVQWDIQEGDGYAAADLYSQSYYDMPETGAAPVAVGWLVKYKSFTARTGANPFYDPYSSELGHLVSVKFDAVVEGRYRVSVWDANRADGSETPVAWLTNPEGKPLDAEDHWVYQDPQNQLEFLWDGVDNIGAWNRKQSRDFATRVAGSFGDEPLAVGEGFYAWNDQRTPLMTQIGDDVADNYRGNVGDIRHDFYPYFTVGQYGKFYVKIEILNDDLMVLDAKAGISLGTPRIVRTDTDSSGAGYLVPGNHNGITDMYVWTHLGEPSQVGISAEEWDEDYTEVVGEWTPGTNLDDWGPIDDVAGDPAFIRNGKPVKLSFAPRARAGVLFEDGSGISNPELTSVQLARQVHLQSTILMQYWRFLNKRWEGVSAELEQSLAKGVVSHMFHNNEKTKEWKDNAFRTGLELVNYEWIFQPEFFKLDFGNGIEESIRYGDFEQLEALPGFNSQQTGGGAIGEEAYMNMAFMNYVFYMSAYTLDRSGRRQWCLNTDFVDRSMIVTPTYLAASPADQYKVDYENVHGEQYLRRSIFAREWKDDDWLSATPTRTFLTPRATAHPGTGGTLTVNQRDWLQFPITDLDPTEVTSLTHTGSSAELDQWLTQYNTNSSLVNRIMRKYDNNSAATTFNTALTTRYVLPLGFGNWDFEHGPQTTLWFNPSPKRDFHPYWTVYMPNWHTVKTPIYTVSDADFGFGWDADAKANLTPQHVLTIPTCSQHKDLKLRDPKGQEVWFGYAFEDEWVGGLTFGNGFHGARLQQSVEGWAELTDSEITDLQESRANLDRAFNYQRQDELARYEQFRGIWSRGPFTADEDTLPNATWASRGRYGSTQPVQASGIYFLNLGRYSDFVVGQANYWADTEMQHWTRSIWDWYYMRFRHEYVWYNDRHFPVNGIGTHQYGLYRDEYTQASNTYIKWYDVESNSAVASTYYDPGAWVGWKDDVAIDDASTQTLDWTAAPILRWGEATHQGMQTIRQNLQEVFRGSAGDSGFPFSSGGYRFYETVSSVGTNQAATATYQDSWHEEEGEYWAPSNIFDDALGEYGRLRLAVGPELPVSRELTMNLVLPTRLRG